MSWKYFRLQNNFWFTECLFFIFLKYSTIIMLKHVKYRYTWCLWIKVFCKLNSLSSILQIAYCILPYAIASQFLLNFGITQKSFKILTRELPLPDFNPSGVQPGHLDFHKLSRWYPCATKFGIYGHVLYMDPCLDHSKPQSDILTAISQILKKMHNLGNCT